MMSLAGKKIVLGVSGGIAAYKTPELVRRLRERGADVRVAMTEAAKAFITPLSLQAVSGYPVSDSLLDPAAEAAMGHIELGKWADLVILAPATADLIARVAAGMANDLVSTICLATPSPVVVVPAMNQQMYRAAATQDNLATIAARGLLVWGPDSGSQACGDVGPGRWTQCATSPTIAPAKWASRLPLPPHNAVRTSRWLAARCRCRRRRLCSASMLAPRWKWKRRCRMACNSNIFSSAAPPLPTTAQRLSPTRKSKNKVMN